MTSDEAAEDRRLVARVASGEEGALDVLYARYRPRLRRYLWQRLFGDEGLVEEALQDTFLAVWERAARFRGEAAVATWVFQIAHNIAAQAQRRGARRPDHAPLLDAERASESVGRDPYAEGVIARMAVHEALGKLSEKHREVLDLFFRQGFAAEEVATILGLPAGTVRSRLSYARKALRQELDDSLTRARVQTRERREG
jgi:RNA polymerase sigma-70 factor (ECF subfamily)